MGGLLRSENEFFSRKTKKLIKNENLGQIIGKKKWPIHTQEVDKILYNESLVLGYYFILIKGLHPKKNPQKTLGEKKANLAIVKGTI